MSIQCLAIEADKENRQNLSLAFQELSGEFQLNFTKNVAETLNQLQRARFDLLICSVLGVETVLPAVRKYLEEQLISTPALVVGNRKVSEHELVESIDTIAGIVRAPILAPELAGKILVTLGETFFMGQMSGVALETSLQLIELDKLTCTISISHPDYADGGFLFFVDGNPIDAQLGSLVEAEAVRKLFSLKGPLTIKMYKSCPLVEDNLGISCSRMLMLGEKFCSPKEVAAQKEKRQAQTTGLASLFMKVKKDR